MGAVQNLKPTPGPSHAEPYTDLTLTGLHNADLKEIKQWRKLSSLHITRTPVNIIIEGKPAEKGKNNE